MTKQEIIEKLYEIINDEEITTKQLNSCNFSSKDINDLISKGIIERTRRGYYKFIAIDDLFLYGKKLISEKNYVKAYECFEKCYKIDPNHKSACFQLFYRSINKKEYDEAFKYLEVTLDTDNPYYNIDNNLFLYLLSFITKLPDKHLEYTKFLTFQDIRVDLKDKRYNDIQSQNQIRYIIFQNKFSYAYSKLNDLMNKEDRNSLQNNIIKTLLFQAIIADQKHEKNIHQFISNQQYQELINYLKQTETRHNLSIIDKYVLKLSSILLDIKENNILPNISIENSENIFDAIDKGNYKLALSLANEYIEKVNCDKETNFMYILLSEICNLLSESIKKDNKNSEEKEVNTNLEKTETVLKQEPIKETIKETTIDTSMIFTELIQCLMSSDVDKAFALLKAYLKLINKQEYENLIINLIKISLTEKDIAFTKPMITLSYLSQNNFKFDISVYIQEFYVSFSMKNYDLARIYLDIISNSKNIGQNITITNTLTKALEKAEKQMNKKSIVEEIVTIQQEERKEEKQDEPTNDENYIEAKPVEKIQKKTIKENTIEISDSEIEYIERNCEILLKNGGIVLLKPMDKERRKRTYQVIQSKYPDILTFGIGVEPNRQIVLRCKLNKYVNFKETIFQAKKAFSEGKYEECIELNKKMLCVGSPHPKIYASIGFCLIKTGRRDSAIEYLTVASELCKQNNLPNDYIDVIANLKGEISEENQKNKVRINIEEFENPQDDYYGIDNFDDINSYIVVSKLDVDSACKILQLNEEQRTRIKLIYARLYYTEGLYDKGDEFLKAAEQNKNKSNFTKKIIEELRKNKKFYINRVNDSERHLTRTLKP